MGSISLILPHHFEVGREVVENCARARLAVELVVVESVEDIVEERELLSCWVNVTKS